MKRQLLIAGGTGLIGSVLQEAAIAEGWEVTILSRHEGPSHIKWNPQDGHISLSTSRKFDAIVNLAGTSIAGSRWTQERKQEIVSSRVKASQTLEGYIQKGLLETNIYVGASGIGIYGDSGNMQVDEFTSIPASDDWMINTVLQWEASHKRIAQLGIRTIILRTGIVLSSNGGALREIMRTSPFGVLGYFGNGRQIWPWIHIEDHVRIILHSINMDSMEGIYLAASPHPVSDKELTLALNKQYSPRRLVLPVPGIFLALLLGEMRSVLFQSCNAYPTRLLKEGFQFRYPTILEALQNLVKKK